MRRILGPLFLASSLFLSGCASMNGRSWGQDATLLPKWSRVKRAVSRSVRRPSVWIPAVATLIVAADIDEDISEWARSENPVFGSQENADNVSYTLRDVSMYAPAATALFTYNSPRAADYVFCKSKGISLFFLTSHINRETTRFLKRITPGHRPNGEDYSSFPSGHTSATAVNTMLAYRNLDYMRLTRGEKVILKTGLLSLTAATAWARIEAKKHWPADTLWGMALGNFIANFMYDAFIVDDSGPAPVSASMSEDGVLVTFTRRF